MIARAGQENRRTEETSTCKLIDRVTEGLTTLMRAVAVQQRLSRASKKDLAERMAAVLNSFGDQWLPGDR